MYEVVPTVFLRLQDSRQDQLPHSSRGHAEEDGG